MPRNIVHSNFMTSLDFPAALAPGAPLPAMV